MVVAVVVVLEGGGGLSLTVPIETSGQGGSRCTVMPLAQQPLFGE